MGLKCRRERQEELNEINSVALSQHKQTAAGWWMVECACLCVWRGGVGWGVCVWEGGWGGGEFISPPQTKDVYLSQATVSRQNR